MALKQCAVSFTDVRGIRHTADVEAESLYEAAVQGIRRLNQDPWIERIGPDYVAVAAFAHAVTIADILAQHENCPS